MIHVLEHIRIKCHLVAGTLPDLKPDTLHAAVNGRGRAHLCCVVHLDLCDLPVAGFRVILQPGLPSKEATHSEHPHAGQEREETTLPANVLPGQDRQPLPCVRPRHRLIVQGELLGLPRPVLQLSISPDLPSHFCYEAKSLFLHHV